jgi:hypothetical protein
MRTAANLPVSNWIFLMCAFISARNFCKCWMMDISTVFAKPAWWSAIALVLSRCSRENPTQKLDKQQKENNPQSTHDAVKDVLHPAFSEELIPRSEGNLYYPSKFSKLSSCVRLDIGDP